ncbi:protein kinase domain-containing protein [Planctomycetes bacterium TBK1r]|uniref:Serine/threonine-protein kinase PrkC n=1 Tax=Stieleria magnilauensis TaxID=2527963 RepID=A0ABX5XWP8_9BACT|nr:Serine/threonine-protein kinase PrkC [Planctomycetes bacterium TBK1r]
MGSSADASESESDLADLVDEIIDQLRSGENIDTAEYVRRFPGHADRIERLIPTLRYLGEVKDITIGDSLTNDADLSANLGGSDDALLFEQLGDFQIVREIGRGGMGIVYEANEVSLDRRVALKVLPFASISSERQLARFKVEAQAAAGLHHSGIVPVYSVGCDRGVHYYAMQYIDGTSLALVLKEFRLASTRHSVSIGDPGSAERTEPSTHSPAEQPSGPSNRAGSGDVSGSESASEARQHFRSMANLAIQAAEALEHAHQSGVIHRDIKPGNLLLDGEGKLWITDFGLARIEQDSELTMTGDLVGTLRYMSPEQATSKSSAVDHRCDVYSLGATLYELLTRRPAFAGDDRQDLLRKIISVDPVPPSKWNPRIPGDLETIVMKAMEKDRDARYVDAQAMADDLRCYLEDRPIAARRPTSLARIRKWGRRHPAIVRSSLAMLSVIALAWMIGSVLIVRQSAKTQAALSRATENFKQSESNRARAEKAIDRRERLLYVRGLGLAAKAWRDGDGAGAAALMRSNPAYQSQPGLRGFEWHFLDSLLLPPDNVVFQSDQELTASAVSRDGNLIAIGDAEGTIRLIRASGKPLSLDGHRGPVQSLDLDSNDQRLASCGEDGTIRIWDVANGQAIDVIQSGHEGKPVFAVRYSNDGTSLASGGGDGNVRLWEVVTMAVLVGHRRDVRTVEFAPDDATIASGSNDRDVRIWRVATEKSIRRLRGHTGMVLCTTFTADGRYLISGSNDHTIRFWNHATGEEVCVVREHRDGVQTLAILADGGIVAGDRGGNLRIWRIRGRKPVDRFQNDGFWRFLSVQLSPDGKSWAGLTEDGNLILRDLASRRTRVLLNDIAVQIPIAEREQLAFSPDGSRLFCVDRIVTLPFNWGDELQPPLKLQIPVGAPGCFAPEEKAIAVGRDGSIQSYDVETGKRLREFDSPIGAITGLRFSDDGNQLFGWALKGPIVRWDWPGGEIAETIDHPHDQIIDLEPSPDGNSIVACGTDGAVTVRDEDSLRWRELDLGERHCSSVNWYDRGTTLALTAPGLQDFLYRLGPDGFIETLADNQDATQTEVSRKRRLFLSNVRGVRVEVLDLDRLDVTSDTNELLQGHSDQIWSLSVTGDGEHTLTASRDGTLRRWSQPVDRWGWLSRRRHVDFRVDDFAWSDGQKTLGIAEIGRGLIYQWPGGKLRHHYRWWGNSGPNAMGFAFESVAMAPTGGRLVTGHRDGSLRFWWPSPGPPTHIIQAMEIDSGVTAITLSPDGRWLAACSRRGNVVKLVDTATWQSTWSAPADDCDDFAFSSDGRWLAYCDGTDAVLVSVYPFREVQRFSGHSLTVNGLAFSPDDRLLVTACEDRKLRIWNPETGELQTTLRGHAAPIGRVTFTPDGTTMVSGDADGVIKLWHLATGQELYTLADLDFGIDKLSFDAGGRVLVALSSDGHIHVFDAESRQ